MKHTQSQPHNRTDRLPIIVAALCLISMMSVLLGMNFYFHQQGQLKNFQRIQAEVEGNSKRLEMALTNLQSGLQEYAESTEINAFFKNRALGMSSEYGLKASLGNIRRLFARHTDEISSGSPTIYREIFLIDRSGELLLRRPENPTLNEELIHTAVRSGERLLSFQGSLLLRTEINIGDQFQGHLLAVVSLANLCEQLNLCTPSDAPYFIVHNGHIVFPAATPALQQSLEKLLPKVNRGASPLQDPHDEDGSLFTWSRSITRPLLFYARVGGSPLTLYKQEDAKDLLNQNGPLLLLVIMVFFSITLVAFSIRLVRSSTRNLTLSENVSALRLQEEALKEKNNEMELIISGAELGTWLWDAQSTEITINRQWARMLGYETDEIGRNVDSWIKLVHPDDWPEVEKKLQEHLNGNSEIYRTDHRLRHKQGHWVWVRDVGQVFSRNTAGEPLLVRGIHIEITELKEAIRQADEARRDADSVISNFLDSLLVVNLQLLVSRVNKETCSLLGYREEDLLGLPVAELFCEPESIVSAYFSFPEREQTRHLKEMRNIDLSLRDATGAGHPVSVNLAPLCNEQGERIGVVAGAKDIATLKNALLEAEQQRTFISNILDIIPGGLLVIGAGFTLLQNNKTFDRMIETWSRDHQREADGLKHEIFTQLEAVLPDRNYGELSLPSPRSELIIEFQAAQSDDDSTVNRVVFIQDITQRYLAEQTLKLHSTVLDQTSEGVIVTDRSGHVQFINQAVEQLSGYPAEQIIDRKTSLFKSGAHNPDFYRRLWDTLLQGRVWRGTLTNRSTDGGLFEVLTTISPIRDQHGEITHYVSLWHDVSHERALQQQLLQAQKLEAIGQLAAGVAHEINTPIQYIQNNVAFFQDSFADLSQLLADVQALLSKPALVHDETWLHTLVGHAKNCDMDFLQKEIPQGLKDALEGIDHVTRIVSAMKEFSHPGQVDKSPTDLNRLVENAVVVTRNEWKYVSELTTRLDPDLPLITCDPGCWSQILLNLIINSAQAIKALDSSSLGTIELTSRSTPDRTGIELQVRDSGCGIDAKHLDHIFEPFFTTKEVGQGTGQGLAIVYDLVVNKHSGTIVCDSEPGRGTRFTIRIPLES